MSDILRAYTEPLLFLILMGGELLLFRQELGALLLRIQLLLGLERKKITIRPRGVLYQHLEGLLRMLPEQRLDGRRFLILSCLVSAAAAAAVLMLAGPWMGAAAGCFSAVIPYVLLRIRCGNVRNAVRNEGETLVASLLSAYRMHHLDIGSAIGASAAQKEELPGTCPLLSSLLLRLRECRSEEEVGAVTEQFADSIGSDWARLLAANIREAYLFGTDVQLALEELLKQMREARLLSEARLRENNETVWMTIFMIPGSLGAVVFLSVGQMGIPLKTLMENQFADPTAASLMMLILILFGFNLLAGQLVRRKKTDL